MKKDFQDDQLWDTLGRAKPVQPSPFFVHSVMRSVRQEQPSGGNFWHQWRHWLAWPAAVAALLLAALLLQSDRPADIPVASFETEVEVITNLDFLIAQEDARSWLDESLF